MDSLWGILFMVLGLILSVSLHEWGHMYFAKKFGAAVPEFSIGFGPLLWKKVRRGTQYSLRAIPLGGFVRILGMFPPARAGVRTHNAKGRMTLAEEARRQSVEELPEGQEHRAFYHLSAPRKAVVMLAGPVMNLVLAVVLTTVAMVGIGSYGPTTTVEAVSPTVDTVGGEVASPASAAGMQAGDRIVSVNGEAVQDWADFRGAVADSGDALLSVVVEREGTEVTLTVDPVESTSGSNVVGAAAHAQFQAASPGQVVAVLWQMGVGTAGMVARLPVAVWEVGVSMFTEVPRDTSGVISVVGVGRLAGEVTQESTSHGVEGVRQALGVLVMLLASLNMALFVFNLIPLPPLDGGHIAGAIYEGVRRSLARLTDREDPGPADTARLMPLTYTVGATLLAMTAVLVIADIVKPITLG